MNWVLIIMMWSQGNLNSMAIEKVEFSTAKACNETRLYISKLLDEATSPRPTVLMDCAKK